MAGRRGMGALGFQFVSADEAQAWVHAYYNAYTKRLEKLADYQTNPNIAVVCGFMCCETDEEALRKADGWTFFAFALRFYANRPPGAPGSVNLWEEYQAYRHSPQGQKMHAGGLVGSPETIRAKLRKFEQSHVDQVILLNQAGRNTHEDICASLELFAARGDAGVPRARRRAPAVEAASAGGRDRARGDRHLARRPASAAAAPDRGAGLALFRLCRRRRSPRNSHGSADYADGGLGSEDRSV